MTKREKFKKRAYWNNFLIDISLMITSVAFGVTFLFSIMKDSNIKWYIPVICFIFLLISMKFHFTRKLDEYYYEDLYELILKKNEKEIKIFNLTRKNLIFDREDLILILLPNTLKSKTRTLINSSTSSETFLNLPEEEENVFYIFEKKEAEDDIQRNDILFLEKSHWYIAERDDDRIIGELVKQLRHIKEKEFDFTVFGIITEGDEEIC